MDSTESRFEQLAYCLKAIAYFLKNSDNGFMEETIPELGYFILALLNHEEEHKGSGRIENIRHYLDSIKEKSNQIRVMADMLQCFDGNEIDKTKLGQMGFMIVTEIDNLISFQKIVCEELKEIKECNLDRTWNEINKKMKEF